MRLSDTTLFFCLARNLNYIRRGYLQTKSIKNHLIIKEKKHDNTKTTRLATDSD